MLLPLLLAMLEKQSDEACAPPYVIRQQPAPHALPLPSLLSASSCTLV